MLNFLKKVFRITNTATAKGTYTLRKYDMTSQAAKDLAAKIEKVDRYNNKEYLRLINIMKENFMTFESVHEMENLVVSNGLEMIARGLSGDVTYTGIINYCTLGDDGTLVALGDTILGNELFRKLVTSSSFNNNNLYVSTFFNQSEANFTIREIGHVVDGTVSVDSGRMYSRIEENATSELPVTKQNSESLTVDYNCIFQNA